MFSANKSCAAPTLTKWPDSFSHFSLSSPIHYPTFRNTAFTAALAVNCLIMGANGYLFALQSNTHLSAISFVRSFVAHQCLAWHGIDTQ
jgi:hypothetical protein